MEKMQPSKRPRNKVKKWCLNKLQSKIKHKEELHKEEELQATLQNVYNFDKLMYYRLRLMLDDV